MKWFNISRKEKGIQIQVIHFLFRYRWVGFLVVYDSLPSTKLSDSEIGWLYTTDEEIELLTQNLPQKKIPDLDGFTGDFYQTFKE